MGIIKKHAGGEFAQIQLPVINELDILAENTDTEIILDISECEKVFEEFKEKGFEEGKIEGFKKGFKEGEISFLKEKEIMEQELKEKNKILKALIETESIEYMRRMQSDMVKILQQSIHQVFDDAINEEKIMLAYFKNIMRYIDSNFEEYIIEGNSVTNNLLEKVGVSPDKIKLTTTEKNYVITIVLAEENIKYDVLTVREKIKSVFENIY